MKKLYILWLWATIAITAKAQTLAIQDEETGSPIAAATLQSEQPQALVTTNAKGLAEIAAFRQTSAIIIRADGYESVSKSYAALEAAGFVVQLTPLGIRIDGVVIAATRWRQSTNETPSKIVSITERDVALQNPQTAADLLGASGKVFIQKSQQGGGSPMIRGFATNRLLYAVDGVRMNTAIFRSGNIQNVISLDPFAIENTEVLFGPGSIIYGSDAIGGVMSFQTLTPQMSTDDQALVDGKAVLRYATANREQTGHFDVMVGWKKWAMATSLSTFAFDDLRMGSYGPKEYLRPFYVQRIDSTDVVITNEDPKVQRPSGYSQINLMQKLRFKPNHNWDFQYGFHYSESSDYARYDRHIRYRNGQPRYGEWYYGPQIWMMNNLNITHNDANILYDQMTIRAGLQSFEESRISRDIHKPKRESRFETVRAWSINFDFVKKTGAKNQFFYGIEGIWNDVQSTGIDENIVVGGAQAGPSRYPQSSWFALGVYVSDQWRASDNMLVQAGARFNQYKLDATFSPNFFDLPFTDARLNNSALNGSLGLVYRPEATWVLSANVATAFRAPNVDDLGKVFDSEPGAVTVPNPDLEAEYAYNADIGVAKTFGNFLKIDLSGYYTILKNAMVRRDFTLNGQDSIVYSGELSRVQAIQNAAVANVYGLQAGLECRIAKGWRFSVDLNYQRGEEELDNGSTSPSRHAPPLYGVAKISCQMQKLNLQLYGIYSAERRFEDLPEEEKGKPEIYAVNQDGNPYSPSWYTLNVKALYQASETLSLSAGMENITDQRYRPYSSGIVAPGRNVMLALRVHF